LGDRPQILIVWECPARRQGRRGALDGDAGRRLARLFGVPHEDLLRRTRRHNLLDPAPEGGSRWPARTAALEAEELFARLGGQGWLWLLLGRRVAEAFGLPPREWLVWTEVMVDLAAAVPHPSGRNRWYNDPRRRRRAERFLRPLLRP